MEMVLGSLSEILVVFWEWIVAAIAVMFLGGLGLF